MLSRMFERVVTVSWGVATFILLIGPFSEDPHVTWVRPLVSGQSAPALEAELLRAA